jgi:hypothetical protein
MKRSMPKVNGVLHARTTSKRATMTWRATMTIREIPLCSWCGDLIETGIDNQHKCKEDIPEPTVSDITKQIIESGEAPWHR